VGAPRRTRVGPRRQRRPGARPSPSLPPSCSRLCSTRSEVRRRSGELCSGEGSPEEAARRAGLAAVTAALLVAAGEREQVRSTHWEPSPGHVSRLRRPSTSARNTGAAAFHNYSVGCRVCRCSTSLRHRALHGMGRDRAGVDWGDGGRKGDRNRIISRRRRRPGLVAWGSDGMGCAPPPFPPRWPRYICTRAHRHTADGDGSCYLSNFTPACSPRKGQSVISFLVLSAISH